MEGVIAQDWRDPQGHAKYLELWKLVARFIHHPPARGRIHVILPQKNTQHWCWSDESIVAYHPVRFKHADEIDYCPTGISVRLYTYGQPPRGVKGHFICVVEDEKTTAEALTDFLLPELNMEESRRENTFTLYASADNAHRIEKLREAQVMPIYNTVEEAAQKPIPNWSSSAPN